MTLKKDMTAADFGSGAGGWTIPLARILEDGKVFAVDVQEEPLSALQGRAQLQGVGNIKKIVADVEKEVPDIENETCDLVLMTDLLFQTDDKYAVFREASRVLKRGGEVVVVEWLPQSLFGPKEGKISKEEMETIAQKSGFQLEKELKADGYHYGLLFVKP